MKILGDLSTGEVLFIGVIVFLAVLIFPRLIRKRRIAKQIYRKKTLGQPVVPDDFKGKTKLPYSHNAQRGEVEELLVKVKNFAFKNEMKVVVPGNIRFEGAVSPSTIILAGRFGLLLIRCYGFGGHIFASQNQKKWTQNMNGETKDIPSPIESMEYETQLMKSALKQTKFADIDIYAASVFTRPDIILTLSKPCHVYNRADFLNWLETEPTFLSDRSVPVGALSEYLVSLVTAPNV